MSALTDAERFGPAARPALRAAVADLAWLLGRRYPRAEALTLVGNRRALDARQREAVRRVTCAPAEAARRRARRIARPDGPVAVDGFNLLGTLHAARAGGVLLACMDGATRDMAGLRQGVGEVEPAFEAIAGALVDATAVRWYLDRPISGSGRLAAQLRSMAAARDLPWTVDVVYDPDAHVVGDGGAVISADAGVLSRCGPWLDLAGALAARMGAEILDLTGDDPCVD